MAEERKPDLDSILDLAGRLEKIRLARVVFGDSWFQSELGIEDPEQIETSLKSQLTENTELLREAIRQCSLGGGTEE